MNTRITALLAALLSLAFFAPGPAPAGWTDAEIGGPGQAGGSTYDPVTGTWVVTGGGGDIWGTGDQAHLVSMSVTGDCVVTGRLASLTDATGGTTLDQWSKAGVMIRDGTAGGAMMAFECGTGANGTDFQFRTTTGGGAANNGQTGGGALHRWLRVARTGNSFQASWSDDGNTWTNHGGAQTIAMPAAALVGLAITAHNNGTTSVGTFDVLTITTGTGTVLWPAPPPTGLVATPGYNSVVLTWNAVAGATSYTVYRRDPNQTVFNQIGTTAGTTFTDNLAQYPNTYAYAVTATIPAIGTSAQCPPVNGTPLQPPISVSATALTTDENLATATFNIQLNAALTAGTINFTVTSSDGTEGQVSGSAQPMATSISFPINAPAAAGTIIPITVHGQDDPQVDPTTVPNYTVTVTFTGPAPFSGFTIPAIQCTNLDNDTPGVNVSPTAGLLTSEAGGIAQFTVRLTTQPTANVDITLVSTNPQEGTLSTGGLTFTNLNWMTPQTVTITGVDDPLLDFAVAYSITTSASSGDPGYNGIAVPDVSVTNLDNEVPPELTPVWGSAGCGLLGLEGVLLAVLTGLVRRRRRT